MREIIFIVNSTPDGYQGFSNQEYLYIQGETMEALKSEAEACVRSHFTNRCIPGLIRLRLDDTAWIHTPVTKHPWYKELCLLCGDNRTDDERRAVIDYFEDRGYTDLPTWISNPYKCRDQQIEPRDWVDNDDEQLRDDIVFYEREYRDPIDRLMDSYWDQSRKNHFDEES